MIAGPSWATIIIVPVIGSVVLPAAGSYSPVGMVGRQRPPDEKVSQTLTDQFDDFTSGWQAWEDAMGKPFAVQESYIGLLLFPDREHMIALEGVGDYCWRVQSFPLPPPSDTAIWWLTYSPTTHTCPACQHTQKERPAVRSYNAARDASLRITKQHPDFATLGWLAWWQCRGCKQMTYEAIAQQQVQAWGEQLGGYQPIPEIQDGFWVRAEQGIDG